MRVYKISGGQFDGQFKAIYYHEATGISGWAVQPTIKAAKAMAKATFIQEYEGLIEMEEEEVEVSGLKTE